MQTFVSSRNITAVPVECPVKPSFVGRMGIHARRLPVGQECPTYNPKLQMPQSNPFRPDPHAVILSRHPRPEKGLPFVDFESRRELRSY